MPHNPDPILAALSDQDLLFICLYGECRGEPIIGQNAVGCVIRNRVLDPQQRYGKGWSGVMLKWAQFSSLWPELGGKDYPTVLRAAQSIGDMRNLLKNLSTTSDAIYSGLVKDITDGADHYFATSIPMPEWAKGMTFTGQFGHHLTYRS